MQRGGGEGLMGAGRMGATVGQGPDAPPIVGHHVGRDPLK